MDKTADYKLEKKSVNNKTVFTDIHKFVDEGIIAGGVLWGNEIHRTSFVEIVGEFLDAIAGEGKIDQWNVICDFRNNSYASMERGEYTMEVNYRQTNCVNTTRLIYTIKDLTANMIKDLIDFKI